MTAPKLTPTGSQTVGPYFAIGFTYQLERCEPVKAAASAIAIRGRVLDRDGVPVPDAVLEFWSADNLAASDSDAYPRCFRRVYTELDGRFSALVNHPAPVPAQDGTTQSPHILVLIFARGLLRHLISRVYLENEPANASDPVLLAVPANRRHTLIAKRDGENSFSWNVVLQGPEETVFFAW